MPDPSGQPATPPPPAGRITRIAVTYTVNTDKGPRHTFHGLSRMQEHIRPERLKELLEDLTMICEELLAVEQQSTLNKLSPDAARIPFEPSQDPRSETPTKIRFFQH
jgi:hypothetical protein